MIASEPDRSSPAGTAAAPGVAVVVDTNVALDWLVFDDPRTRALQRRVAHGGWRWCATAAMRDELADVLGRPQFARWDAGAVLQRWDALAALHPPPPRSRLTCADPDDQVFIDLAVSLRAGWLVTRDKELLRLGAAAQGQGLTVCPPWLLPAP